KILINEREENLAMCDIDNLNGKFVKYDQLCSINVYFDDFGGVYNLDMVLAKDLSDIYSEKIKIRFFNITNLYLNDVGNRFTQFCRIYIEKNLDGWDGVKYNLNQLEDDGILFKFFNFELLE
ncbi:hypothetical protein ACULUJ_003571, partial [Acinetobacter baumannii]